MSWNRVISGGEYIDPQYRDRAPELIVDGDGKERFQVEGNLLGPPSGWG